jgi:ABC-type glycerol-3-phosphate transport system substrate-binding protein
VATQVPAASQAPAATQAPGATQGAAGPVKLVVLAYELPAGLMQPQLDKFKQQHPNITTEYQEIPYTNFLSTVQSTIQGGSQLDVIWSSGLQQALRQPRTRIGSHLSRQACLKKGGDFLERSLSSG